MIHTTQLKVLKQVQSKFGNLSPVKKVCLTIICAKYEIGSVVGAILSISGSDINDGMISA